MARSICTSVKCTIATGLSPTSSFAASIAMTRYPAAGKITCPCTLCPDSHGASATRRVFLHRISLL
ncbi:uncharacterized protein BDV14DRAFT_172658 [Aspergillus stella-maris]|uniref:uncharacterized protein n=1 Tax=Aspergillus stella-maris TaxID=1810926 RepID=UPI003CCD2F86